MKKLILFCITAFIIGFGIALIKQIIPNDMIAGRGCCSHHGGVCGCAGSRARCCDGSLSPSCQCFRDDIKPGLEI